MAPLPRGLMLAGKRLKTLKVWIERFGMTALEGFKLAPGFLDRARRSSSSKIFVRS